MSARREAYDRLRDALLGGQIPPERITNERELAALAPSGGVIWGLGNYQGFGARLTAALAGRDAEC